MVTLQSPDSLDSIQWIEFHRGLNSMDSNANFT